MIFSLNFNYFNLFWWRRSWRLSLIGKESDDEKHHKKKVSKLKEILQQKVHDCVRWCLGENCKRRENCNEQFSNILSLSYHHLKPCLLYIKSRVPKSYVYGLQKERATSIWCGGQLPEAPPTALGGDTQRHRIRGYPDAQAHRVKQLRRFG